MTRESSAHDGEVIERSLIDAEAFEAIFDRHFDAIYSYVARRAGAQTDEVVASETFCVAFDRRHCFDVGRIGARPWLYGIATNLLRRHWRSEGWRRRANERLHHERITSRALPALHDRIDAAHVDERLRAALAGLRDGDRTCSCCSRGAASPPRRSQARSAYRSEPCSRVSTGRGAACAVVSARMTTRPPTRRPRRPGGEPMDEIACSSVLITTSCTGILLFDTKLARRCVRTSRRLRVRECRDQERGSARGRAARGPCGRSRSLRW